MSIRIKKITLGGRTSIDIRRCKEIKGEPTPTKSGISIDPELWDGIIKAVKNANGVPIYVEE